MANQQTGGGIGLGGALFLLFAGLKLTGNLAWSWWWVTAPLWIPLGIVLVIAALFFIVLLIRGD